MKLLRLIVMLVCLSAGAAQADEIEVIPLQHRTAEQLIPTIRPLVAPGGAVTGMQSSLIIRSTRANIEDIKRVLASLDREPRRLRISVRQDAGGTGDRRSISGGGTVSGSQGSVSVGQGAPAGSGVSVRILDSSRTTDHRITQQVQVLEGSPAYISVGASRPVPTRSTTVGPGGVVVSQGVTYQDASTGFTVVPRLAGDRVTLDINPRRESLDRNRAGGVSTSEIVTTASGRLGEWIELGGVNQSSARDERGILSRESANRQSSGGVWVKVDEVR
jgi:type II secretory pathway component GspD/PulD (secretin)